MKTRTLGKYLATCHWQCHVSH